MSDINYFVGTYGPITPVPNITSDPTLFTELAAIDCAGYKALIIQVNQTPVSGTGALQTTLAFQCRNDPSEPWESVPGSLGLGGIPVDPIYITYGGSPLDQGIIWTPVCARYMRAVINSYDKGADDTQYSIKSYVTVDKGPYQPVIVANTPGQESMNRSQPVVISNDQSPIPVTQAISLQPQTDSFTATGPGTTVNASASPVSSYSIEVTETGSVTSWSVDVEASLDSVSWTTVATHTNISPGNGKIISTGTTLTPALYFRTNCTAITLGGGTSIAATVLGV